MRLLFKVLFSNIPESLKYIIMKKFKKIDLTISIALIVGSFIYCPFKLDESLITAYFIVGGWQVISMIVHQYNKWFVTGRSKRSIYHWITLISIITLPLGAAWLLLYTAPFMAIYYTWLCYHEVTVRMQRPLALLK